MLSLDSLTRIKVRDQLDYAESRLIGTNKGIRLRSGLGAQPASAATQDCNNEKYMAHHARVINEWLTWTGNCQAAVEIDELSHRSSHPDSCTNP